MEQPDEIFCENESNYSVDIDLLTDKPIIFRGLVDAWPSISTVSQISELQKNLMYYYSGEPITAYKIHSTENCQVSYNKELTGFNFTSTSLSLSALFELILSKASKSDSYYMGSTLLDRWFPRWTEDNPAPFKNKSNVMSCVWLGNRTNVPAHFDFPNNLVCVVAGKRRFTLFPPEQIKNLYVGPLDFTPAGQPISLVDAENPDFKKYPRYRNALKHAMTIELETGDAMYIPSLWWHQVTSLDDFNMLVNYWWRETPMYMGNPMDALKMSALSINHLPKHEKEAWFSMFREWVFSEDDVRAHIPKTTLGNFYRVEPRNAQEIKIDLIKRLNR